MVAPLEADSSLGMTFGSYCVAPTRPDGTLDLPGEEQELPRFPDGDLFLMQLKKGCLTGAATVLAGLGLPRSRSV